MYEPPETNASLRGEARKGGFPWFIPKTDQERIQNLGKRYNHYQEQDYEFEWTEKLEGSSMTVYIRDEEEGVS